MRALRRTIALVLILAAGFPARADDALPACHDHAGFRDTTLTLAIYVPEDGRPAWREQFAPTVVAERLRYDLNRNSKGIRFVMATDRTPDFNIVLTIDETTEGPAKQAAKAEVTSLSMPGFRLKSDSGPAPFDTVTQAIDRMAIDLRDYFLDGWVTSPPCVRPDGSIKR